jgi:hypothetical protein
LDSRAFGAERTLDLSSKEAGQWRQVLGKLGRLVGDGGPPAQELAKEPFERFGIPLCCCSPTVLSWIVVKPDDWLAGRVFAASINCPFPPIRIDKVGETLELLPLLLVMLALEPWRIGSKPWGLELDVSAD